MGFGRRLTCRDGACRVSAAASRTDDGGGAKRNRFWNLDRSGPRRRQSWCRRIFGIACPILWISPNVFPNRGYRYIRTQNAIMKASLPLKVCDSLEFAVPCYG